METLPSLQAAAAHESEEADKIILQHACMAGGATLIVGIFPCTAGLDIAFAIPILYGMYTRINSTMNIAFTKHKVQSIAKMVGANVLGNIAAFVLAKIVVGICRWIPGVHLVAAGIDAGTNAVVMYICGKVYKMVIANLQGAGRELSPETIREEMEGIINDPGKMKELKREAKERMKGRKFKEYKGAAEEVKKSYEEDSDLKD